MQWISNFSTDRWSKRDWNLNFKRKIDTRFDLYLSIFGKIYGSQCTFRASCPQKCPSHSTGVRIANLSTRSKHQSIDGTRVLECSIWIDPECAPQLSIHPSILPCPRNYPSINHRDKIADKILRKRGSVAPWKFENCSPFRAVFRKRKRAFCFLAYN